MEYELVKQLKDAGFRMEECELEMCTFTGDSLNENCRNYHYPTLSELIEACDGKWGQRFRWLGNEKTHWSAQARPIHGRSKKYPDSPIEIKQMGKDIKTTGKTPEEAVARLWLALNKK